MKIKLKKERVILSDLLPYETPITFSNRYFYEFIVENEILCSDYKVSWRASSPEVDALIYLIFGISLNEKSKVLVKGKYREFEIEKLFITVPFSYGISHKEGSFRTLSVIHPRNQIQAIGFYEKYKELIIYYSQVSEFSLRAPSRIASTQYFDDEKKSGSIILANSLDKNNDQRYKSLKSFFGYRKISNIHQFFESNDYHSCEQKYNNMAQLDVSKCFNSVYTHSIAWATFGRDSVKKEIAETGNGSLKSSFPDDFDVLMQKQNYNETNGILIGPELSRIFAEIILQRVDHNVEKKLNFIGLNHKRDYEIFRYVDDYFVFYNNDQNFLKVSNELEACLNEFKFGLNLGKSLIYHKPIITEMTSAKRRISQLLSDKITLYKEETDEVDIEGNKLFLGKIKVESRSLITLYKMIISDTRVEYKNVINYTLVIVERIIKSIFLDYTKLKQTRSFYRDLLTSIHSIIDFCFFIYSAAPRVNTTIKLTRVLKIIIDFSRTSSVPVDDMHQIFKKISDHVSFVINKYETSSHTQVETLYLLTLMAELGKDYWVDERVLVRYFGGIYISSKTISFENTLNYFSITVLLFYIRNKKRYSKLKVALEKLIINKIKLKKESLSSNTECLLLALDCISCPYLDVVFKKRILRLFGVGSKKLQESMVGHKENWFTKWTSFEFGHELDAKQSVDVY